jgi:Kef-type K+ transport system membrane component KefB/Trk K+ transport system NAD-binding subunit
MPGARFSTIGTNTSILMEETRSFAPLLIVFFLAFIVPLILLRFKRLRIPIVVGELVAGIIVGRSGLGWVEPHDPVLELLADFGFVFLMFLSGVEIDFSSLGTFEPAHQRSKPQKWGPLQLGAASFILTLTLSLGAGYLFTYFGLIETPWMMALILSTTSLGVVVPVLKEKGVSRGSYGQSILVAALIADFATMFLITILVAAVSTGLTLDILLIGVLFVAFFLIYRFGMFFLNRPAIIRRTIEELNHATAQIKVRAAFTIMLVFVALSESTGAEVILGAFLAGAIISLIKRPDDADLEHQLNVIGYGFFIPIFFIMVGVNFNLAALAGSFSALTLALMLILAAVVVKIIPALIFKLSYTWRQAFGAGAILSARLSLIIAASAIGLRLGIINELINSEIVLVSLVTVSIAPLIFSKLIPSPDDDLKRLIIVVGAGNLGIQVAEHLSRHHDEVLVIANTAEQQARAQQRGIEVLIADADQADARIAPYYERAQAVVCIYSDPEKAFQVCKQARLVYGIDHVVARVDNPQDITRFRELGVITSNASMDQAVLLAMLARNLSLYQLLTKTDDDKDICEVTITKELHFGQKIRDLKLPGDLLIVALQRENEMIIPTGGTELEKGDRLSILGKLACIEVSKIIFE